MCSQADDPSQHDDPLRAALDDIVQPCTQTHATGTTHYHVLRSARAALAASATDEPTMECPKCGGPVTRDERGFLHPFAASATDEGGFCPDCGNVPGSQRWNRVHAASVTEGPRDDFNERWCPNGCGTVLPPSDTHWVRGSGYSCEGPFAASATDEPTDD